MPTRCPQRPPGLAPPILPLRRAPPVSAVRTPSPASRLCAAARIQSRGLVEHLRVELAAQLVTAGARSVRMRTGRSWRACREDGARLRGQNAARSWPRARYPCTARATAGLLREEEEAVEEMEKRVGALRAELARAVGSGKSSWTMEGGGSEETQRDPARGGAISGVAEELNDKGNTYTMAGQVLQTWRAASGERRSGSRRRSRAGSAWRLSASIGVCGALKGTSSRPGTHVPCRNSKAREVDVPAAKFARELKDAYAAEPVPARGALTSLRFPTKREALILHPAQLVLGKSRSTGTKAKDRDQDQDHDTVRLRVS
ncbi:hypothetical protein FB451DRAFT_1189699 [Mycena latifolia]|nr:hypothetical protein FB451DRAFT_1189699 [Mycena latifolia]